MTGSQMFWAVAYLFAPVVGFYLGSTWHEWRTQHLGGRVVELRESLAALTSNYEAMYEARYQAGYEAGLVQGMAEQRELTRAAHSVRGQKAAQTRKQRQEAA